MSKAYPSNLSRAQDEFVSELFPEAKPGGRPRTTDLWQVLNAIFYVLVEGCRWRSLPADVSAWQTVSTDLRNWRKDGTWQKVHDQLWEWSRIEADQHPSPSEAIIDLSVGSWDAGDKTLCLPILYGAQVWFWSTGQSDRIGSFQPSFLRQLLVGDGLLECVE